ncbi:MAG: sigma-54 dependent transcriptional regulator [Pseudomonadota bacterium]
MSSTRAKILIVDESAQQRESLSTRIKPWGFDVTVASSAEEAHDLIAALRPGVILANVKLPDSTGFDLLDWMQENAPYREVVLMATDSTVEDAVQAMKRGTRDFLTTDVSDERLQEALGQAREVFETRELRNQFDEQLDNRAGLGAIVGASRPMRKLYKTLRLLAQNEASAIITGESGTGKEMVARTIYELSVRRKGPFVALNMAALPEGLTESELFGHEKGAFTGALNTKAGCFELADGGLLFLDEFAEMPIGLQPKLLRVLEERRVRRLGAARELDFDVRVLAATNREPMRACEQGVLREDLYYRLNVFTITLEPLRNRVEDIGLLAQSFIRRFNKKHGTHVEGLTNESLERLQGYPWPGNVRELRNVLERAVILANKGWISKPHLPPYVWQPKGEVQAPLMLPPKVTLAEAERILIMETLKGCGNNKAKAARQLGLDVKTIRNKLKAWDEND